MKQITQRLGALAVLFFCSFSYSNAQTINPGSGITPPTGPIQTHQMGDDGHVQVPIPFGFPYYGQVFTHSFMFDNGVVGLFTPGTATTPELGCNANATYCGGNQWGSQPFSNLSGPQFNYMIAPLWTDLLPRADSTYTTQGDSTQITYSWNNLGEYYNPGNTNSFDLQLKPSGGIGIQYREINIGQSNVSVGLTGNLLLGEYVQHFWAPAGTPINTSTIPSWSIGDTGVDICLSNPLISTSCAGYADAYFNQQCSISALYNPSCPGYQQAYFAQQCSLNTLYNINCPGYADAFFAQQCNLDGLYSNQCPNYAEAYAKKNILNIGTSTQTTQAEPEPVVVVSTASVETPQLVSDPVVNTVITTTATSASPAQSATATVPLVAAPEPVASPVAVAAATEEKKEEKKETASETTSPGETATTTASSGSQDKKDQPKSTRQAMAERRLEAARAKAVEEGKQLANKMGEAATMEAQVAVQNVVIQAMGFTPGFDAYGRVAVPDAQGYRPFEIYPGQRNIDTPSARRLLTSSDRLHNEMIDQQYTR